jgi:hypothetical protein
MAVPVAEAVVTGYRVSAVFSVAPPDIFIFHTASGETISVSWRSALVPSVCCAVT